MEELKPNEAEDIEIIVHLWGNDKKIIRGKIIEESQSPTRTIGVKVISYQSNKKLSL